MTKLDRSPRSLAALITIVGATLALAGPATAGEAKPVISTTGQHVEVSVTIDDALKNDRGLYENLLAEARHGAAKWRTEAIKERAGDQFSIREGRTWTYSRSYTLRSEIAQRYVSVVRTDGTYEGGAHPNSVVDTILWDADTKRRISMRPLLNETADNGPTMTALATAIRLALAKEKKARGADVDDDVAKDTWLSAVKPQILKLGAVVLAPSTVAGKSSGLVFYFSPYAVGSYAESSYTAFVPWADFRALLPPAGEAIFAGERPPKDGEE
jgi:hypothetical protein